MALGTTYTDYKKISDIRLNKVTARRTLANTIERASTLVYNISVANTDAGDHHLGTAAYDMELVKGYISVRGDEGTDGAMSIEKWDNITAGSAAQLAMTDAVTATGGAIANYTWTPNTDGSQYITAGEFLSLKTAGIDGTEEGIVTLVFKLVDNVNNS